MSARSIVKSIILIQAVSSLVLAFETNQQQQSSNSVVPANAAKPANDDQHQSAPNSAAVSNQFNNGLEGRMSDKSFIADILDRLHSLDADIGKLLFNSTSMYAADDQSEAFRQNQPKGGERFTEVLSDLDSLQDEVS